MNISEITGSKIKSFVQGYSRYYFDNMFGLPEYIKEQVYYRLYICRDTCLISGKCEKCSCPTIKKAYASKSCNLEKFPDLMSNGEWRLFKEKVEIPDLTEIKAEVDKLISNTHKDV
jgi:hypothetical protein